MKNIRRDRYGYRAYVKVGRLQEEKRFKPDAELSKIRGWIAEARAALHKRPQTPGVKTTLKADVQGYLAKPAIKALLSIKSRQCELWAWVERYGSIPRQDLTRQHVLEARDYWLANSRAPKTINHRVRALRHLYRVLDGSRAATPCDDVPKLKEPAADPRFVPVRHINMVLRRLTDPFYRGICMVLTSTGQRPAQLRRARRTDVRLAMRSWHVRPAKGGQPIPLDLTPDMLIAWRMLIAANGFTADGTLRHFDGSDYVKALYAAGWNKAKYGRPYNAKHTVAITLAESGAEWEDIKDWFGLTDVKTIRIYTGLVRKRLKRTSERLHGRLGWTASGLPAARGTPRHTMALSGPNQRTRKRA